MTDQGIVFAADRNLSQSGKVTDTRRKVLGIEYLDAAIGYFGTAEVGPKREKTDKWLQDFIDRHSDCKALKDFVNQLKEDLEAAGLTPDQQEMGLGLHLAGYTELANHRLPDFWLVLNYPAKHGLAYPKGQENFGASEDFWRRDVQHLQPSDGPDCLNKRLRDDPVLHFNGYLNPYIVVEAHIRSLFQAIWAMSKQGGLEEFKPPATLQDYVSLYLFRIELTVDFYDFFSSSHARPIGGGVDVITISVGGTLKHKYYPPRARPSVS
jgi:hypothetical protein